MRYLSFLLTLFFLFTCMFVSYPSSSTATDTCTSDTMNQNLYCTDDDDDCSVCSPYFDWYSLEFKNANSVNWNPNGTCFPYQYNDQGDSKSYCNYSINGNEIVFYFNQDDDYGLPQLGQNFNNNVETFVLSFNNETAFFGITSNQNPPYPPENNEMYFVDCGELTVDDATVNVCFAQQHNFGHPGHLWLMAAPAFEGSASAALNGATILSCFSSGTSTGIFNSESFYYNGTSGGGNLGALNCSCLVNGQNCDDLNLESYEQDLTQEQLTNLKLALSSTKKLGQAIISIADDFSNLILDLTQPAEDPEELAEMALDFLDDE